MQGFSRFETAFKTKFVIFSTAVNQSAWVFQYHKLKSMHACQHMCDQTPSCAGFVYFFYDERFCLGLSELGVDAGVMITHIAANLPFLSDIRPNDIASHPPSALRRHARAAEP